MKKVILILTMFVIAVNLSAQVRQPQDAAGGDKPTDQFSLNFVKADGRNRVEIPGNRGVIEFEARGDIFNDVVYVDASGKETKLRPNPRSTAGVPNQPCEYPIPDACFGSANKKVLMCICRPTDISQGGDPNAILIGLLLPAVQKVREAAR